MTAPPQTRIGLICGLAALAVSLIYTLYYLPSLPDVPVPPIDPLSKESLIGYYAMHMIFLLGVPCLSVCAITLGGPSPRRAWAAAAYTCAIAALIPWVIFLQRCHRAINEPGTPFG